MKALAVVFLVTATRKIHDWNLNMLVFRDINFGRIFDLSNFVDQISYYGPYKKTFFFIEWP